MIEKINSLKAEIESANSVYSHVPSARKIEAVDPAVVVGREAMDIAECDIVYIVRLEIPLLGIARVCALQAYVARLAHHHTALMRRVAGVLAVHRECVAALAVVHAMAGEGDMAYLYGININLNVKSSTYMISVLKRLTFGLERWLSS